MAKVEAWGAAFQKRVRGSMFGDECIVCGRRTGGKKNTAHVAASPCTGNFVAAAMVGTTEGHDIEASMYPVGSECAKAVRREWSEAFPKE